MGELDQQQLQIAPLMVARSLIETDPTPEKSVRRQLDQVGIFLIATAIAAVILIWRVTSSRRKVVTTGTSRKKWEWEIECRSRDSPSF